jgi:hypothetical protein
MEPLFGNLIAAKWRKLMETETFNLFKIKNLHFFS